MASNAPNLISSGIEPVDKLLGGLESGQLYLVHGDAAGKSLFGIKFLIEGLKRGESGALVIRYSPEDAVRRFARLGYDCLEDIYSGRLVILEYSNEIIEQVSRLKELGPVLRELEWLLGESRPARLIFDPVTHLIAGRHEQLEPRVREFAAWASSFGATVVMVASGDSPELVRDFLALVRESFRFEVKDIAEKATRFLCFEKSVEVPDQAIEVDPSRGVFLVGRAHEHASKMFHVFSPSQIAQPKTLHPEGPDQASANTGDRRENQDQAPRIPARADDSGTERVAVEPFDLARDPDLIDLIDASDAAAPDSSTAVESQAPTPRSLTNRRTGPIHKPSTASLVDEPQPDVFSDLLSDLADLPSPIELEATATVKQQSPEVLKYLPSEAATSSAVKYPEQELSEDKRQAFSIAQAGPPKTEELVSPSRVDLGPESEPESSMRPHAEQPPAPHLLASAIAARAVEILLRPPESRREASVPPITVQREGHAQSSVQPRDFNILVIDDDPVSCELLAQSLSEYTVETVHDGVTGLAKLISFKPDLVIIDVDLPVVDGFKVLAHIRASLNTPIIVVSGTHVRASDRVLSAELGADYYLTKPFSVKEVRQKARQLIARYRGISAWIVNAPHATEAKSAAAEQARAELTSQHLASAAPSRFTSYQDFSAQVEKNVKTALDIGSSFSIVGCRLAEMTSNGGKTALRLFELVRALVRDADFISTNPRNDLVILLADADSTGAQAFINRLRERVAEALSEEPTIWMRSFPDLEESTETKRPSQPTTNGSNFYRRASDRTHRRSAAAEASAGQPGSLTRADASSSREKRDPRQAYIDFLEHL